MLRKDQLDAPWASSATVDAEEIARFTELAEEWWNPDGKFRAMHDFNPVRRDYILDCIATHFGRHGAEPDGLAGLDVLDVGCGAGLLCEPVAEHGARVVGIDATARNIEVARWHSARQGLSIDYRHTLAADLRQGGESFDVVLNTEVVEHVTDVGQLLADCSALVRPGGIMIVATLNRTLRAYVLAIVGAEYVLGWLPRGTHDWRRFVRPVEISSMLTRDGLQTANVTGVTYNPLRRRWRLSRDISVNYMLRAVRPG